MKQIFIILFITFSIISNAASGYILYIQPYIHGHTTDGITRSQLIQLINHSSEFKPYIIDIDTFDEIMDTTAYEDIVPYHANTLAMELSVENDSIMSMKYLCEPVKGIIYIYEDTNSDSVFYDPEIIWISEKSLYRDNYKFKLNDELKKFLSLYLLDIELPSDLIKEELINIFPE